MSLLFSLFMILPSHDISLEELSYPQDNHYRSLGGLGNYSDTTRVLLEYFRFLRVVLTASSICATLNYTEFIPLFYMSRIYPAMSYYNCPEDFPIRHLAT